MTSLWNLDGLCRLCRGRTTGQKEGRGNINIPLISLPALLHGHISKQSNLSSTPRTAVGSHQTAGSSPAPRGISPLAWFSRNRPHCLRRITATGPLQRSDVRLDGSIIVPASDHGRYREPPGTDSRLFLAPCQTEQAKDLHTFFSVVSCCFCLADSRAAAVRALAFAKEAGMCLMNGYAVFKVR